MTPISSINNLRDLGGLKTKDGHTIRKGLLLRGGSLISVSDEDISILRERYDLRRVFDLRSEYEIQMAPDRQIPGVSSVNLELIDLAGDVWKRIINSDADDLTPMDRLIEMAHKKEIQDVAAKMYVFLSESPNAMAQYSRFLRAMSDDTPGATLWHCSFGKDRTGVTSALILGALGCSKQTILDDYALSNVAYGDRVQHVIGMIPDADPQRDEVEEVIRTFIGANVKYFEAGLDAATGKFGSALGYITGGLGITNDEIRRLRDKYLE